MQHGLANELGVDTDATARLVFAARERAPMGPSSAARAGETASSRWRRMASAPQSKLRWLKPEV